MGISLVGFQNSHTIKTKKEPRDKAMKYKRVLKTQNEIKFSFPSTLWAFF
jgi:hypothetical protein